MANGERLIANVKGLLVLVLSILAWSCTNVSESTFSSQIVIQGYLYANEPLDSIVVRQTIPIGSAPATDRIPGALVTLLWNDSSITLKEDPTFSGGGRYISSKPMTIQPGVTYSLRVEAIGQVATASTTVPSPIHLDSVKLNEQSLSLTQMDTITYPVTLEGLQSPGIHLWWSASAGAAGYGIEALTLDTTSDYIFDALSDQLGDSTALGRYRYFIISTNEQVVWPQFTHYGPNVIRALALDKNYEDFILGVYLSGSQFNNSTLDVSGGLGIFGSAARASKEVYLK